jgi:mannosyltransferase
MNYNRIESEKKYPYRALALIALLALALRLVNLGGRPIWYDEAFAVLYAEKSFGAMIYGTITQVQGAAADVHPLLYYFSLHLWMGLFGQSPFAVRLPSAILGVATVVLIYFLARELAGRKVGLAAALLTAIAPFHVAYSQEARMYSLLAFACLLALYFFVRFERYAGRGNLLGFTLAGALALYSHNLAFLFIAAIDSWVLLRRRWSLLKPLLVAHLGMAILFGPWLSLLPAQFGKVQQAYWVPRPGPAELVRTLIVFTFNLPLPDTVLPVALFLSLLILALAVFETWRSTRSSASQSANQQFALFLAFAPLILMFLISQVKSVYVERGLLPSALVYYVALAWVLVASMMPRAIKVGLVLLYVALAALSLGYHYLYAEFPRPPFEQATAYLRQQYRADDAIVHDNKLTFFPCHYYDRSLPQSFVPDPPGSGSDTLALPTQEALGLYATPLQQAAQGHRRVWFVIFQEAIYEYVEAGEPDHPDKVWLEERYRRVDEKRFNDLIVYLYEK